ncbi:UvrD-helicase domain-containing protein [Fodinisporobacter ferrooxydans]|uniref:UvrD-helicase domain-containing protein n=1 Tax=Fodinisporobacter ferrooxydans TaxID=2901836 RepID=A0ABY4CM90_9BACL|nr:UvrD-helicase domain-containing protein [Alicyclobacillaceae bacterium MYW30-H2]
MEYNVLLDGLNDQQREAVLHKDGSLLVISGPGSGKTTILTRRIAYLLNESKGETFKILALTFTTKAANEMKERIEKYVGNDVKRLFIGTFHSFCCDVLRKYGSYIGIDNEFTLYENNGEYIQLLIEAIQDELARSDSKYRDILMKFKEDAVLRNSVQGIYAKIIQLKNRLIAPAEIHQVGSNFSEDFRVMYQLYNEKLRANNVVDFADLLFLSCKLFQERPFIGKQYRNVYRYLLIDEAQDTNKAQFELIQALCGREHRNVFVVACEFAQ